MPGAVDEPFASAYIVTQMPSGEVLSEVQDYGLYFKDEVMHARAMDRRPLTMFDCQQLIETLSLVDNSRGAELVS
jgi:hypothetical protein